MVRPEYLIYFIPVLFGFVHGILFALILVFRGLREERLADILLAVLLGSGCLLLLPTIMGLLDIHVLWNEWLFLPIDPGLLIGPLLYLYIKAQTNRDYRFQFVDSLHFVPYLIYAGYHIVIFSKGPEFVFSWMDEVDLPVIDPIYQSTTLILMSIYLIIAIKHYASYRKWIEHEFVDPDRLRYPWITRFLVAMAFAIFATCVFRVSEALQLDLDYTQSWWSAAVVTTSIYYISLAGYMSKRAPRYSVVEEGKEAVSSLEDPPGQYHKDDLRFWLSRLVHLMESKQVYLDHELNLGTVAKELGLSRKQVSAAINAYYGTNFKRFVNEYRVGEFKELVLQGRNKDMTLFGLALECGFNSKATFNRVFKQIEGVAPNVYARTVKKEETRGHLVTTT